MIDSWVAVIIKFSVAVIIEVAAGGVVVITEVVTVSFPEAVVVAVSVWIGPATMAVISAVETIVVVVGSLSTDTTVKVCVAGSSTSVETTVKV